MADPEGGAAGVPTSPRSRSQKQKKRPCLGRNMVQNASFEALNFKIFRTPVKHIISGCGVYKCLQKSAPPVCRLIPGSATGIKQLQDKGDDI